MKNKIIKLVSIFSLGCLPPQVYALTKNTGVMNQASVSAVCMVSADNLNFGNYNPISGSSTTANANIYVTCVNGASYYVYLNAGNNSGSNILNRNMIGSSNGNLLSYQLYANSSLSGAIWGDGTSGSDIECGVGTGSQAQFTVYGNIPGGQTTASADSYSDSITVSVTY